MESFTIQDIELLTGIKSHTLRIWEQHYLFFKARGKKGRQRFFSNRDLQKLFYIAFLYHNGWKASEISVLSDVELWHAVSNTQLRTGNYKTYIQKLLGAAVDFNEAVFLEVLNALTEKVGFEKLMVDVCYPYLQRIGVLWNTTGTTPVQQHFSGYLIQNRLISETEKYTAVQNGEPEIVLFCPDDEQQPLPLLYLNYLLRKNGWRVLYLGKNIKPADVKKVGDVAGIRYLYVHRATRFAGFEMDDYLETLCKAFPGKTIAASGQGTEGSQRTFVQVKLLKSDEDIHRFIQDRI